MNRRAYVLGAAMVLLTNFVAVALRAYAEVAFLNTYTKGDLPWLLIANAGGFAAAACCSPLEAAYRTRRSFASLASRLHDVRCT